MVGGAVATDGWTGWWAASDAADPPCDCLVAVGGASVASVIFMEFCPTHCRAEALVCVEGSFWTFGSLIEVGVAWAVLESTWDWGISRWRALLMVSSIPNILAVLFYFWYPPPTLDGLSALKPRPCRLLETPQYLALSGDPQTAALVLQNVAHTNGEHDIAALVGNSVITHPVTARGEVSHETDQLLGVAST